MKTHHWKHVVRAIALGRHRPAGREAAADRHLAQISAEHQDWWLHDNVIGLCIARRRTGGRAGKLCLQVLVEKKYAAHKLPAKHCVPRRIVSRFFGGAAETDVRAVGKGSFHGFVSSDRPARPGFDIGSELGGSGTLASVVVDRKTKKRLGLSCAHVLAPNGIADIGATPGQVVLYPSFDNAEALDILGDAPIGTLVRVCAPSPDPQDAATNIDAAVFEPDDPASLDSALAGLGGPPLGVRNAVPVGLGVQKVGAATETTLGVVQSVSLALKLPSADGNLVTFVDHIGISSFGQPGDSGALVMDEDRKAVGLYIGGFQGMSVCTPIARVLSALDCSPP